MNPYEFEAPDYDRSRPEYPPEVIADILRQATSLTPMKELQIADIGAGTGKLSRQLLADCRNPLTVWAVEPACSMRQELGKISAPNLEILPNQAESTGLYSTFLQAAVFAQSWHWMDELKVSLELERVLLPGATVWIIFNQLDVRIPWVKRLSRIMRSGDVHHLASPPLLGDGFTVPSLTIQHWDCPSKPEEIMRLGRTRSSYLRASSAGRKRMQTNLNWYLEKHLCIPPDNMLNLPYITMVWQAQKIS
ncbi:class I SAM-dependent methyltransferase [Actinomycetaceae bacterium TAE3-ERU4]|nr:class I SAM-dependent methyltransferase [Actinomycetaceae bacterium TAE3-ERU4]